MYARLAELSVDAEAGAFGTEVDPAESARRIDLRGLPLVTIDGETARDFDDAVLNVGARQQHLGQLRAAEGSDNPAVETMLARTPADRIADEKAANHPTVASSPGV
jgi:exoribonuclease II